MTLRHTYSVETSVNHSGPNDPNPETRTRTDHVFSGPACVSLSHSCVEFGDPYGDPERVTVRFWGDRGEVSDAVCDWLHNLRREVDSASGDLPGNRSAERCLETLQRIAGELGFTYPVPEAKQ